MSSTVLPTFGLSGVCEKLSDRLEELNAPRILFGNEYLAEEGMFPRIVCDPIQDSFNAFHTVNQNPRQLRTRLTGSDFHVWGADYPETERLMHVLIRAIHNCLYGDYILTGGKWNRTTIQVQAGREYILGFQVQIPVTEDVWFTAPQNLTKVQHGEMEFSGSTQTNACGS